MKISEKCCKCIREFLSEFLGTLILVTIGCSSIAQAMLSSESSSDKILYIGFGWGFAVFAGLAVSIKVTGHLNPAMSLALFIIGKINLIQLLIYSVAQYLGAFCGAAIVYLVYMTPMRLYDENGSEEELKKTAGIFSTYPGENIHPLNAFVDQTVATSLLALCILAITDKRLNKNANQSFYPLHIGLLVSLLIFSFGHNCG